MEEIIFPNQIRMYRRLRGRSMQELADHLGVSLSAISKIEKGYRRVDQEQLVRVAEFLDCPLQELFVNEQNSQQEIVQAWRREQERRNKINEKTGLKTLGAGLRQIRNEKNLTLIEVSESSDMTLSVYHRIEIGQREVSDKEFKNIAKALGITPEELRDFITCQLAAREQYYTQARHVFNVEVLDSYDKIQTSVTNLRTLLNI